MAQSYAHRWGQIIGNSLEQFTHNILTDTAKRHGLYLDSKGPRKIRGNQLKVTWQDGYGNKHDLDYVLERGGTNETRGIPVAFVESAWRRYTKHSKNKVQEIEAAVMPVALTFSRHQPFLGAILAGEFTENALSQLISKGFAVLHIPYGSVLDAFNELGIDASSEDGVGGTSEAQFREKIEAWESLPQPQATNGLLNRIYALHRNDVEAFRQRLDASITRRVTSVRVTVLHGHSVEHYDVESAINYLIEEETSYYVREDADQREAFEVQIQFSTDARITATFAKRVEAIAYLRTIS